MNTLIDVQTHVFPSGRIFIVTLYGKHGDFGKQTQIVNFSCNVEYGLASRSVWRNVLLIQTLRGCFKRHYISPPMLIYYALRFSAGVLPDAPDSSFISYQCRLPLYSSELACLQA